MTVVAHRRGFTLTELLVAVAIILVLMAMIAGAVSAARGSQKKQATQALIAKLDLIIQQQYATYISKSAPLELAANMTAGEYRSWYIRRNLISADLPDRWTDVAYMASGTSIAQTLASGTVRFPLTSSQSAYVSIWNAFSPLQKTLPGSDVSHVNFTFGGAECLFMIIMQGGIANCLDCGGFRSSDIGDIDQDGAPEFLDSWGNPIGFLLWPAAVELPSGSGVRFFSGNRSLQQPFQSAGLSPSPGLGMRPLIYSAGPDGEYGYERKQEASNLSAGAAPIGCDCGNWDTEPCKSSAGPLAGAADNITNFDAEAKQ